MQQKKTHSVVGEQFSGVSPIFKLISQKILNFSWIEHSKSENTESEISRKSDDRYRIFWSVEAMFQHFLQEAWLPPHGKRKQQEAKA